MKLKATILLLAIYGISYAQVGINNTTPQAILDIAASNQATPANTDGILVPRVDAFPATNPTIAQDAMVVYLTTTSGSNAPGFYYWNDATTTWLPFSGSSVTPGWELLGNAGTDENVNFIGTTDAEDVMFRRNNIDKMRIDFAWTAFTDEIRVKKDGTAGSNDDLVRLDDIFGSDHGRVTVYNDDDVQHYISGGGATEFNLKGLDYDFRIESTTNANAFLLDATDGQIQFGDYGSGTFSGTPTQSLAVDTNGDIIEQPLATDVAWALLGNAGTVNGTNFLGTTDDVAVDIRTNNVIKQRFNTNGSLEFINTSNSVYLGESSGSLDDNSITKENVMVGVLAGQNVTSGGGSFPGKRNTGIGYSSLNALTNGGRNTAVGHESARLLTTGEYNTAIGVSAMENTTTSSSNTGIGFEALMNMNGASNTAIGYRALVSDANPPFATPGTGTNNTAVGRNAGSRILDGSNNTWVGKDAEDFNQNGNNNVVIGTDAGASIGSVRDISGRVLIGFNAGQAVSGEADNTLFIENSNSVTPLIYGEFDNDIVRIGGQLQVGSSNDATVGSVYGFPTVDGATGQALVTDGAGNVSWSNASAGAWSIVGNAGTNDTTNFLGTTDAVDLVIRTANTERVRIDDATGNTGINSVPQTWAKTFSFSNNAGIDGVVGFHNATGGFGMYGRSVGGFGVFGLDTGDGVAVQGQIDSEIGIGVVAVNQDEGLAIYAETSGAGDSMDNSFGVYSVIDQATDSGNENSAPIGAINVTAVSGSGFASPFAVGAASAISGVTGVVASKHTTASNDEYSFGVVGEVLLDTSVGGVFTDTSGGVLGSNGQGDFGILGYQSANGTLYSVYGGGANGSIAAGNTGRSSGSPKPNNTIGIGLNSGFMGGYLVGSQYGIVSKGKEFGSYTMGNTIVNNPIIHLDDVNTSQRVATYASMSTSVDVTSRGKGQLKDGSVFVAFDENYSKLIDAENININITPMGETKGVFVTEVTERGFRVKENMSGTSNARFNWTAVATKKNFENGVALSSTILSSSFDENMNGVMHNDEDKSSNGTPIYFDGSEIKFQRNPNKQQGNGATILKRDVVVNKDDSVETKPVIKKD